jgi:adenylate kinase
VKSSRNIVIFIGPPGAGKGSLSSLCIENLQWVQLSTGNLCRKHIAQGTVIGKQIDQAIREGKLVDDSVITSMVNDWLLEQQVQTSSVILDGYPRTVAQAESLMHLIQEKLVGYNLHVVKLAISDEHVLTRLGSRAICKNKNCQAVYSNVPGSSHAPKKEMECDKCSDGLSRRADDEHVAIVERLKTYYKHEQDLLGFYQNSGISVKKVNVEKALPDIFKEFKSVIGLISV